MLLLKMLLFCEVCTLFLQMETLPSRHLPAQMDWLAFPAWGDRRAERATGGRRDGLTPGREHPGPGCAGTESPGALVGNEQHGHR